MQNITLNICNGAEVRMTALNDGTLISERYINGRWFVATGAKDNTFTVQENLEGGEVVEIATGLNMVDALYKLAWADSTPRS